MFQSIFRFFGVEKDDKGEVIYDPSTMRKIICCYQPNSVEHIPAWETNKFSVAKKTNAFYGTQILDIKTRPSDPILSQTVHAPSYFLKIYFKNIVPSTSGSSKWSISLFPRQHLARTLPPTRATCPAHSFFIWSPEYYLVRVQNGIVTRVVK